MTHDRVLYVDTTTSRLMLALGVAEQPLQERAVACESHRYHSALVIPAIQNLLKDADCTVKDLSALAVNIGPGSFTGIRTGIITVRTMAQFLNLPVFAMNRFELLACTVSEPVSVYLDALRDRAYHARLQKTPQGFVYHTVPSLVSWQGAPPMPCSGDTIVVSPTLTGFFEGRNVQNVSDELFTPAYMAALLRERDIMTPRPWRDVRPLYIQEPSVTIRKKSPHTL